LSILARVDIRVFVGITIEINLIWIAVDVVPLCSVLAMHVSTEPMRRSKMLQDFCSGNAPQGAVLGLLFEIWLEAEKLLGVSLPFDSARPIVA
jgi:hypothetical protein